MLSPNQPEYWNARYLKDNTPWDFSGVPADLKNFLQRKGKGAKVLIPGCGSGYEVKVFAEAGYDVTAIDFAPFNRRRACPPHGGPGVGRHVSCSAMFFEYDFPIGAFRRGLRALLRVLVHAGMAADVP